MDLANTGNKLCGHGKDGNVEIHLPSTRSCDTNNCGADGEPNHISTFAEI